MTEKIFIHDHPEFEGLLSIVSERRRVASALAEKDYWVTHTLWALCDSGLQLRFKGGTSLSKGFDLIQRFSEDLDLKIEAPDLPTVTSWTSEGAGATQERERFFRALEERIQVPGAEVVELSDLRSRAWRGAVFAVRYPGRASDALPDGVRPFIQLEVGSARVTPCEERSISSWVHDFLAEESPDMAAGFIENRPAVHCVLPEVTLLEKVEAICRRFPRDPFEPWGFIRHYEDAARILSSGLIASNEELRQLLAEMTTKGDIRDWPTPGDPALDPDIDPIRWDALEASWRALGPMFWGERISLPACAKEIRDFVQALES